MPAFNAEKTISYSINSVLQQTHREWELIIIDDGSTDRTAEIVRTFSEQNQKVIYLYQQNAGPGKARNNGINISQGEYIAFLDSDDYWEPDFLSLVNEEINKGSDYIFYDSYYETPLGNIVGKTNIYKNAKESKENIVRKQLTGVIPWGMSKVVKKKLVHKATFGDMDVGEENIFSFDAIRGAKKISFLEKPLYHYVQLENSQHTKGKIDPWKSMLEATKKHIEDMDLIDEYARTINSLAVRSLCIACYRCSISYGYKQAVATMKRHVSDYYNSYDLTKVELTSIDKVSLAVMVLIRLKFFPLIYFLSKMR